MNGGDGREQGEAWVPASGDTRTGQRATAVLLFRLAHPRGAVVFPPPDAASLHRSEPWWKILRSLALEGRRGTSGEEIAQAVEAATASWNTQRHPFSWGRRRRHRARRPGSAALPKAA